MSTSVIDDIMSSKHSKKDKNKRPIKSANPAKRRTIVKNTTESGYLAPPSQAAQTI